MAVTIWKYPLEVVDRQTVMIPAGARLLDVQVQGAIPCLWALVDSTAPTYQVVIRTHGTGHELEPLEGFEYVATYQLNGGALVFHVFAQ